MVMVFFNKTSRSDMDLALTRGESPFSIETLERITTQEESFLKPRVNIGKMQFMAVIPLAIIAFLVLKK